MTPQEYDEEKIFVLSEFSDINHTLKKEDWYAEHLTKDFKDDLEVMTACIKFNSYISATASPKILDDKVFILSLVKQSPTLLRFASDRIIDDVEVVKSATTQNGHAFDYASDRIKSNPQLIAYCCKDQPCAMNYINDSVKSDPAKILELMKAVNFDAYQVSFYASDEVSKLINNADPVRSLEAHLLKEKLQSKLAPKSTRDGPKMKI